MNPKDSKINFAVPNEQYLHDTDKNMGRIIPPGIITKSCEILQNKQNGMIFRRHQKNFKRSWMK